MKSEFVENLDGVPDFPTCIEAVLAGAYIAGMLGDKVANKPLYKLAFCALSAASGTMLVRRTIQFEEAYQQANPSIRAKALED